MYDPSQIIACTRYGLPFVPSLSRYIGLKPPGSVPLFVVWREGKNLRRSVPSAVIFVMLLSSAMYLQAAKCPKADPTSPLPS